MDPGSRPSVIATLDLSTTDYYNRLRLFNVLNTALNRGYLDTMRVSPKGFSFRTITGRYRRVSLSSSNGDIVSAAGSRHILYPLSVRKDRTGSDCLASWA